ncbi:MAG: YfhO family protein [Clostridiales bacterium]|jgi:uncharacterized membrane protein YfhO|nr:YfhO family protein [Clostridiales bacterium]
MFELMKNTESIRKWLSDNRIIFVAYAAAFAILLVLFAVYGVYPFGSNHILQVDAVGEYVPRLNEFMRKLKQGESLIYSWEGGLGNDFYIAFLTYLQNPLLYLGLLFGTKSITEFFALVLILQIPFCALTSAYYFKSKGTASPLIIVLFSLMYAFCAYVTAYFQVYYWIAGASVLPLLALSIERIFERGKFLFYAASLGAGIISSYMIGLFLCCFSVLYFMNIALRKKEKGKPFDAKSFKLFTLGSVMAAGLAAFVLIPAVISLPYTVYLSDPSSFRFELKFYFSLLNFFTAHYFYMTPSILQFGEGLPNIYTGLFSYFLFALYFANGKIPKKEKLVNLLSLLAIYLFFSVNILDYAIHGFHYPAGLPHRFSFIYSFFVLKMAFESFGKLKEIPKKRLYAVLAGIAAFSAILMLRYPVIRVSKPGVFSLAAIFGNIVFASLYFYILTLLNKGCPVLPKAKYRRFRGFSKKAVLIALSVIIVAELSIGAFNNMNQYKEFPSRELYVLEYYDSIQEAKALIEDDTAFYRMEHFPDRVFSDGKLFGYNGISEFTIPYGEVVNLFQKFGMVSGYNKIEYRPSTPLANAIFSVKYIMTRGSHLEYSPAFFKDGIKAGKVMLRENPYALPIAFMIRPEILSWKAEKESRAFDFQNIFVNKAAGISESLYGEDEEIEEVSGELLDYSENSGGGYDFEVSEEAAPTDVPNMKFSFTTGEEGLYYLNLGGKGMKSYTIELDAGDFKRTVNYPFAEAYDGFDLGSVPKGSKVTVTVNIKNELLTKDAEDIARENSGFANFFRFILTSIIDFKSPAISSRQKGNVSVHLARMDSDVFMQAHESFADEALESVSYTETQVSGKLSVKSGGVLFTSIPYDKRWHVYANGKELETVKIMDALLGVVLEEGEYELSFENRQPAAPLSIFVSVCTLGIAVWLAVRKRKTDGSVNEGMAE